MPSYRAREPIYLNEEGRLIEAGEVFSSNAPAGLAWIALDTPPPSPVPPVRKAPASGK